MPDSLAAETERFHSLDLMSTLVAVLRSDGAVQFANAALENTLGLSRRTLEGADFSSFFTDPALLQTALAGARGRDFAALLGRRTAFIAAATNTPTTPHRPRSAAASWSRAETSP